MARSRTVLGRLHLGAAVARLGAPALAVLALACAACGDDPARAPLVPGCENQTLRALPADLAARGPWSVGAVETSLALVNDRRRIVTIVAPAAAAEHGLLASSGADPETARYRDEARIHLVEAAEAGDIVVPVAREYPLAEAPQALAFLADGHPGGKIALIP